MSRLDSFIRRLQAQRACLDHAIALVSNLPGPVLEFGLGNGRTYDHLRAHLPGRAIYVFEREVNAHPDCVPPSDFLLLGDVRDTLPGAARRIGEAAALAHLDIGTGDDARNAALAGFVAGRLGALLAPGAVVVSDQALAAPDLRPLGLPAGIPAGRYFMYRRLV